MTPISLIRRGYGIICLKVEEYAQQWELTRSAVGEDRLSIVMPLYRLAAATAANLVRVAGLFERNGVNVELVAVDDGSADGTDGVLSSLDFSSYHHVVFKPVVCAANGGKGAALKTGFEASCGKFVMLLDGDLDVNPSQTPLFFEALISENADVVVGSKRHPRSLVDYPWHRRLVSWAYFSLVRLFVGLGITDTQTGMKLFRRQVLGEALSRMLVKTYAFDLELLTIASSRGAKIAEAPVRIDFGNKFGCLNFGTVRAMAIDSLAVFYRLRVLKYYSKVEVPRPLEKLPMVSVVIACPNGSWMLDECLSAIAKQTYENFEVIVLPDGCELQSDDPRVRFIPTGKVRPAEKRNIGIKAAKGALVAFIDDDAYPDAHWLEYAVKYFSEPSIGAVGGPGITPASDGYMARIGGRVYCNLLVSGNYRYRYKAGGVRRDVDDYPSCNLFVRKSLLDRIGGYRTDFWPGEDTLLCKDIVDSGFRIVYDPWVVVHHHRRALFAAHLRQLGRYAFHRGYFVKRYPSNSAHLSYFIPSAFVAGLPFVWWLWPLYAFYGALVAVTSFSLNPATWLLSAVGVFSSHVVYGVRFIEGLCAKKAPCEYIGKDHV